MDKLIKAAIEARKNAVAKLTGFRVGAALETSDGRMYTGANYESEVCSLSMCAERTVIGYALTNGERKFRRLAVVGSRRHPTPPCGACRQFIAEFAPNVEIIMSTPDGRKVRRSRIKKLVPMLFRI